MGGGRWEVGAKVTIAIGSGQRKLSQSSYI